MLQCLRCHNFDFRPDGSGADVVEQLLIFVCLLMELALEFEQSEN